MFGLKTLTNQFLVLTPSGLKAICLVIAENKEMENRLFAFSLVFQPNIQLYTEGNIVKGLCQFHLHIAVLW